MGKETVNHSVKSGKGYRLALYLEQDSVLESLHWFASLYFEQKLQQTNLLRQIRRDFGIEFGIHWGDKP